MFYHLQSGGIWTSQFPQTWALAPSIWGEFPFSSSRVQVLHSEESPLRRSTRVPWGWEPSPMPCAALSRKELFGHVSHVLQIPKIDEDQLGTIPLPEAQPPFEFLKHVSSLPEFMNFNLLGKTILVVNIKLKLFVGPSTQQVSFWGSTILVPIRWRSGSPDFFRTHLLSQPTPAAGPATPRWRRSPRRWRLWRWRHASYSPEIDLGHILHFTSDSK